MQKMGQSRISEFLEMIRRAAEERSLSKLVLSKRTDPAAELRQILVTLAEIRGELRMKFVFRYPSKDITKHHDLFGGLEQVKTALEKDLLNADLFTSTETVRLFDTGHGRRKIRTGPPEKLPAATLVHDRIKMTKVATEGNIWLRELGVLNTTFGIRPGMNDKFRQVNRYLEILAPVIEEMKPAGRLTVTDMGAGKGYLTFALYEYLCGLPGVEPRMTGVEGRKELVDLSNRIARDAGFEGLTFVQGTIRDTVIENPDILVALHACDTATDDAIYRGITSGASLIVCAPCCHKQVRKEFKVKGVMEPVVRHGILEERQAEIVTDAIRALVMEMHGYSTRVFEFIATEHTPKNLMIVGRKVRKQARQPEKLQEQIVGLKALFGVESHYLETLFPSPPGPPGVKKR